MLWGISVYFSSFSHLSLLFLCISIISAISHLALQIYQCRLEEVWVAPTSTSIQYSEPYYPKLETCVDGVMLLVYASVFARRLQLWNKWSGEVWRFIIREPIRFPEQHRELGQITGEDIRHKHLRWIRLKNKPQLITSCLEHLVNISITCNHC